MRFNDIPNGEQEPVKAGDTIIIYWWTDDYNDLEGMYKEEITIY